MSNTTFEIDKAEKLKTSGVADIRYEQLNLQI